MTERNYCFTLFKYDQYDRERKLEELLHAAGGRGAPPKVAYITWGREVCPESGQPHLQGFLATASPSRPQGVMERLKQYLQCDADGASWRCWPRYANSTNPQAIAYCHKDGDWVEFGRRPRPGPACEGGRQGQRTDLQTARDAIRECESWEQVLDSDIPEVVDVTAKYGGWAKEQWSRGRERLFGESIEDISGELRPWQRTLCDMLREPPDPRCINVLVDNVTGIGKSTLADNLADGRIDGVGSVEYWEGGISERDFASAFSYGRCHIFDLTRDESRPNWKLLESLKNGRMTIQKYQSRHMKFPRPHVWVFMNNFPDLGHYANAVGRVKMWETREDEEGQRQLVQYHV